MTVLYRISSIFNVSPVDKMPNIFQGVKTPLTIFFCYSFFLFGCKKLVEVTPPTTSLTGLNTYTTDGTAIAVMTGIYSDLSSGTIPIATGLNSLSIQIGLSADELQPIDGADPILLAQYQNQLTPTIYPPFWSNFFAIIHTANAVLEGCTASTSLTPSIKNQLLGEALTMRALADYYLVNLFGDVPLVTTTDYQTNALLPRNTSTIILNKIIEDLKQAQGLLSTTFLNSSLTNSSSERVRPTKWAATALLARAYLLEAKWDSAEFQASLVIANSTLFQLEPDLNDVFLKNSMESIWQLQPVNGGWNTEDAKILLLPSSGPDVFSFPIYISTFLANSFERNDLRKDTWLSSVLVDTNIFYYPTKYKSANYGDPVTEYLSVIRLAEMYLIRSEARAEQNNLTGAQNDLNTIRTRASLDSNSNNNKAALLDDILNERRHELFTEWGHRWFDLKRTGNLDKTISAISSSKGGNWNSNFQLFPIPFTEILLDNKLQQNPGY